MNDTIMKVLVIIFISTVAVNCGLLKELIQPVTDSVHKGELFNQKEQKEDAKESKGVLDKLVTNLDAGAEKLVDVLTGGIKPGGLGGVNASNIENKAEKPEVKTESSKIANSDESKVSSVNGTDAEDVIKKPEVKELDISSTTLQTVGKDNDMKIEEVTTPKVDEVKPEEVAKKVEEIAPKDEVNPEDAAKKVEKAKTETAKA